MDTKSAKRASNSPSPSSHLRATLSWPTLHRAMKAVNRWVMVPCMLAVVLAAAILSYSVAARYFFKIPTEWQDETAIFLLMGAIFFSAAFVQSHRGHVGVEAVAGLLSARANHWRMLFVEVVSLGLLRLLQLEELDALSRGATRGPRRATRPGLRRCGSRTC